MKQQYRINSWRHDVPTHTYSEPSFEGETVEVCDLQALAHFRAVSDQPNNSWEGMDIVRIDAPAIAEEVTFLERNGRQGGDQGGW